MPEAPLIVRGGRAVPTREVEQVLLSHPAVAEAAVVGVPDRSWGEIVGAAVRLTAPLRSAAELAAHCRTAIPGYQVPERWLFTATLPRTPDGEVCRGTVAVQLAIVGGAKPAPVDFIRPRAAIEGLGIPRQVRRSRALEDL